jgi:thiol-disulfide isomerase/thioredoxin
MKQSKDEEGAQELRKCLALSPDAALAEQARKLIADPRRARLTFAPEFRFTTLQGQEVTLQQLQGKIVVFDFWATWCPPCRRSVPELKELTKRYADGRLVLVSVSADRDEKAWRDFIAKKSMDWPQFLDKERRIIDAFSVEAYPTYLVIDGEGIVRQRIEGLNPQESVVHRLKSTLEALPQLCADKNQ